MHPRVALVPFVLGLLVLGCPSAGEPAAPGDLPAPGAAAGPGGGADASAQAPAFVVDPLPDFRLGARVDRARGTVSFRLWSERATRIELDLYAAARGEDERLRVQLTRDAKTAVWSAEIPLADVAAAGIKTIYYGFRAWGPNWPYAPSWTKGSSAGFVEDIDAQGNRFDPNKLVYDPYALEISHDPFSPEPFDGSVYEIGPTSRSRDSGRLAPKGIVVEAEAGDVAPRPTRPLKDDVIYEVQVRGLTKTDASVDAAARGTYRGAAAKAAYLKSLGVTAIELLPLHESQNDQNDTSPESQNYWGYASLSFFAPDRRFASDKSAGGPTRELRAMIHAFHAEGIKVFVDVVYNHTGEGGPNHLLSWRGIDAAAYYEAGDDARSYADNNGVGPNFHPRSPAARQLVLDSLRYYSAYLGVDGFRFDLAAVLGDSCPSYCFQFDKLAPDNVLNRAVGTLPVRPPHGGAGVDLIAEPWGIGAGTYQLGNFPTGWAEWNGSFRDTVRTAQNRVGVADITPRRVAERLLGSADLFADDGRPPSASINFVVAHDGFTLRDLFAYDMKNNEQRPPFGPSTGGSDDNVSWSQSGNPSEQQKAARTAMLLLAASNGVPMMLGGDELYRTQRGNNNAYNLDTEGSWLDWTGAATYAQFHAFVKGVFTLRGHHAALRPAAYFDGKDHDGNGLSDATLLDTAGRPATPWFLDDPGSRFVAFRVDGEEAKDVARSLLVAYNWAATPVDVTPPPTKAGKAWYLAASSDLGLAFEAGRETLLSTTTIPLAPRTAVILLER